MRFAAAALLAISFSCPWVSYVCAASNVNARADFSGKWDCHLDCPGGILKFGLVIEQKQNQHAVFITNGDERIKVPVVKVNGKKLELSIEHYDSKIVCERTENGMEGFWKKRRGPEEWVEMKFQANKSVSKSYSKKMAETFVGRWFVKFEKSKDPAVGIFNKNNDNSIAGTFLTTTGDYRFLHGSAKKGMLELSCFDGAHAFLFRASLQDDGTLAGDFWSSNTWHEKWTANRNSNAQLPDAFLQTSFRNENALSEFTFPSVDGKPTRLDDKKFNAKARLIYVFGSWCPNCHDAAAYFKELKSTYGDDLSIVGLAFELTGDFDRDSEQVKRYMKRHDVDYPILIAGLADKRQASNTFPILDQVRSYPTTIFLNSDNEVRAIHTGFTGPATGKAYTAMKTKFETQIRRLIKHEE